MGKVYSAFKRNRAMLHVPKVLKNRSQTPQAVFIERPIRSIGRLYGKLPPDERARARRMRYEGHRPRAWLEGQYKRFERITKYANFT